MSTHYVARITMGWVGSTGAGEFVLGGRASGKYVPLQNQPGTVGRVEQAKQVTYSRRGIRFFTKRDNRQKRSLLQ
jgi:hypothetical protein